MYTHLKIQIISLIKPKLQRQIFLLVILSLLFYIFKKADEDGGDRKIERERERERERDRAREREERRKEEKTTKGFLALYNNNN